ncbi:capsule biosynthesis GfcC family protein [Edwardsiella tarda]|uniref:Capsule biosynthesis GfcC family protein n=1 Tax=Edwardsiella tarda ATCC 15947 = NBRC 105688 TaxID=667121 RepID=A0AC61TKT7_EDWTA|nr:capsule biosynthesis GfcC D2 domain-containing protein [Edwardsiella tarda]UAL55562.1 capsule biosynthesis GfcC family protein [Edwardsiella tarda]UCQ01382.1 capsule biosynthesis GfcC family protein [Edwardsiella tarda ATCC 15947 = NBRC 105688]UCQ19071.1 capsule biosynthesis GfcC family protein [Edwardsiella tarda]STD29065.1 SLBB-domain like (DUF1017) [Edwardsiella tarda]
MKIALLSLLLVSGLCQAQADVQLSYQGKPLPEIKLGDDARLATLLNDSRLPSDIYWRSAQITTPAHQVAIEQQRRALLNELGALETLWRQQGEEAWAESTRHLIRQLSALRLTGRLPIVLDPRQAQRSQADNPRLVGDYQLFIAPRRAQVMMLGLIHALPTLPLIPAQGVNEYWRRDALLPAADSAHVWLIQPTGDISQVPVAVWNKRLREPMAGASILIGFDPNTLPSRFQGINQRIAEIISNRVPE